MKRRSVSLDTQLEDMRANYRSLERRIEQLEAEQHGHCRVCKEVTAYPTVTLCKRMACADQANRKGNALA